MMHPRARKPTTVQLSGLVGDGPALRFKVLRRGGEPLLLVPVEPNLAAKALSLYPAQRSKARWLRSCLQWAGQLGLPVGSEEITVALDEALAGFIGSTSLAILCGNPRAAGRRFVILKFAPEGIIKVGAGEEAGRLIEREAAFLKSMTAVGIPKLRGEFAHQQIRALALDFIAGDSPSATDYEGVEKLLLGWLQDVPQTLNTLPAWKTAQEICGDANWPASLGERVVRPAISHGDFAPWNIKVSPRDGSWTALDWERGERAGIPGWDWFHYVIQYGILVRRESPAALARRLDGLLQQPAFRRYCAAASIEKMERELVLAYLLYFVTAFGSAESGNESEKLLHYAAALWRRS